LRKDHRPYVVKKLFADVMKLYVQHFICPQLEYLGEGYRFLMPWHVKVHGAPIEIGKYVNMVAASDSKIRLTIWPRHDGDGSIKIGDYCLICPGVRISSAAGIVIGDNSMLANRVYITDSDWHDIYNRTSMGNPLPVNIEENAWIGDSAIICKGVTIGRNSIIGAGSIVTRDVPPNTIAAGNPARPIKELDPNQELTVRSQWFGNPEGLFSFFDRVDKEQLKKNSFLHWFRHLLFPRKGD